MRKSLLVILIAIVSMTFLEGCMQNQNVQQWEYVVVHFTREDYDMNKTLNELGKDGWEYAGPITNNGMNAKYIAFKRPLVKK
jgi:hypothetical protein